MQQFCLIVNYTSHYPNKHINIASTFT